MSRKISTDHKLKVTMWKKKENKYNIVVGRNENHQYFGCLGFTSFSYICFKINLRAWRVWKDLTWCAEDKISVMSETTTYLEWGWWRGRREKFGHNQNEPAKEAAHVSRFQVVLILRSKMTPRLVVLVSSESLYIYHPHTCTYRSRVQS